MSSSFRLENCSENDVAQFAQELAFMSQPGDLIALSGDLGAGKTTFARSYIRALVDDTQHEIPSPTYTLVQTYETPRMGVAHFDLYRLNEPEELLELGLDHFLQSGVALIEWPEKADELLPTKNFHIHLEETSTGGATELRTLVVTGSETNRIRRLHALHNALKKAGWAGQPDVKLRYLQGDASVRRYARLKRTNAEPQDAIVMDWAEQPDGPPVKDGQPYSRIAHLAESVQPFLAVTKALRDANLSAPQIYAADTAEGFVLLEDFGNDVFQDAVRRGEDPSSRWRAATDVLLSLRKNPPPKKLTSEHNGSYQLPVYDAGALAIESELLIDWYWPAWHGNAISDVARAEFVNAWSKLFETLETAPKGWVLRDYHSPNLISLPERSGVETVGLIDVQDALLGPHAYDLVSLLQDARVDIPQDVETTLLDHYCQQAAIGDPSFDEQAFRMTYAILGTQRNTKILGIFARLAIRDHKPNYMMHTPRLWRYLARNLAHPALETLQAWYDNHFPVENRTTPLKIS